MNSDYFGLVQRNNGIWYYYCYDQFGRRVFKSTKEKRKTKAFEIALAKSKAGELLSPKVSKHIKFEEYAKDFWVYETCPIIQEKLRRRKHASMEDAANKLSSLRRILLPEFGRFYLEELTTAQLQTWLVNSMDKYGVGAKTANDYMKNMRQILEQALLEGYLMNNPAIGVKPLEDDSPGKGSFTLEQIRTLFKTPWEGESYGAYVACLLSAKTGMRSGEIRALTVEQLHDDYIDCDSSWADIEGRKSTKAIWKRIIPVEPNMITLLKEIAPMKSGLIFTTNGETPVANSYLNRNLTRRMKMYGISKTSADGLPLSFHSFRYFFNTRLIIGNISESKIHATIGHESDRMTEHYTRLTPQDFKEIREIQESII